jgi:hypothetical protein
MKFAEPRSKLPFELTTLASCLVALMVASTPAWAAEDDENTLKPVTVLSSRTSQLGVSPTANTGVVTQEQLEARTVYRPGELLEATPGLVVSQHSGEGKANQFYLRGFNLDHGTDLRTTIDGMPVNQRSHAHGQGWTDLNFLIPELATLLDYKKGPFYASEGDFASAGAVSITYADQLKTGIASLSLGENGYFRTLVADSPKFGNGNLLYAVELFKNDGPFVVGDNYQKANGVLRYSQGTADEGFNITGMAYQSNKYHATDQIPKRALDAGTLGRFGAIDQTDGGEVSRYSLSAAWHKATDTTSTLINVYAIRNKLALYSDFTYFQDDPVNGDQFNQNDERVVTGLNASHTWSGTWLGYKTENTVGLQLQNDNIYNGLYSTVAQRRLSTTREDHIVENTTRWLEKFRTVAGIRADAYLNVVTSDNPANSGTTNDSIASPKLNLIFGPWSKTEFFAGFGNGFHSNDARGTTITVAPKTGDPADRVPALVRSQGFEIGVRSEYIPGLQSSFSLYQLDFASELTFSGDAGDTQAGRPSRRVGFEFSNYYKVNKWLTVDADLAFAKARFRDLDPVGDYVPGGVEGVASVALAVDHLGPYFGALQFRYFGPRPLIEDNSIRSDKTATLNARVGYKISPKIQIQLEAFNLTNEKSSAIDYFYSSQLKGEAAPVDDIHLHPIESRSLRFTLTAKF